MGDEDFKGCQLAVSAEAPGKARAAVSNLEGIDDLELHDARLLVSELVTNAVLHASLSADDTIDLSVRLDDERLRVEVTDTGGGFDDAEARNRKQTDFGRGLQLVHALADRWAGAAEGEGFCVWFELDHSRYFSRTRSNARDRLPSDG